MLVEKTPTPILVPVLVPVPFYIFDDDSKYDEVDAKGETKLKVYSKK